MTKPQISIGSALSNSVVLTDADVLPRHAVVSFAADGVEPDDAGRSRIAAKLTARSERRTAMATIEATDGAVLAGIQLIDVGQAVDVALPCTVKFGSCTVELARPKTQRASLIGSTSAHQIPRRAWIVPTVATLAGVAGLTMLGLYKTVIGEWGSSKLTATHGMGINAVGQKPTASFPAAAARPVLEAQPAVPGIRLAAPTLAPVAPTLATSTATTIKLGSDDRQLAELRERLAAVGLDKVLSVDKRGNMLVVDGIVSSANYGRWREVKDALLASTQASSQASTSGTQGNSVITDLVKTSTSANVPTNSIASVILGKTPYVMSANGRRARIGEVLEDGWTVETISADTVTMRRGQTVNRINPADGFSR